MGSGQDWVAPAPAPAPSLALGLKLGLRLGVGLGLGLGPWLQLWLPPDWGFTALIRQSPWSGARTALTLAIRFVHFPLDFDYCLALFTLHSASFAPANPVLVAPDPDPAAFSFEKRITLPAPGNRTDLATRVSMLPPLGMF